MTLFALSGLLILITSLGFGLFVLIKTPNVFQNRLWGYFNFAIALWGLGAFEVGSAHDPQSALLWMKLAHVGVICIPVLFLHFTLCFLEHRNRRLVISIYLIGLFFLITLLTGHLLNHVKFMFNSFYYSMNPPVYYYIFFFLWMTSVVYTYQLAYNKFKNSSDENRNKIKYFFTFSTVGYIGGVTNFFPIFGINLYPYGNFLVAIFPIVMTYIILKYNLMDINIIIRRSLIYSLLVTTITFIFFIFVLVSEHFFHQVIHYQNVNTSIIIVGLIALVFTPLKNKIQNIVDMAFFKATPMEMAQQNEQLRQKEKTLADLYHQADKLSKTDTLTETNNRRHFSEMLNKKIQDSEAAKTSFYLVIFDVDRFKEINDTYGHSLGDLVLIKVVEVVKNNTRSNDFIGRFGGDEFVICLDFAKKEGILSRLTKIRDGVKALSFTNEGQEVSISVSIGAAKFMPGANMTEKSLIERADAELFNVKKSTRGEIRVNE